MQGIDAVQGYIDQWVRLSVAYAPKVLTALISLVVGLWLIKRLGKLLAKAAASAGVDPTLIPFLRSLLSWLLKAALLISAASALGVPTASFVAVVGAAGIALGLALQGSLSNFAGGVLLLIFRPYKLGDLIEAQGFLGHVKEIQVFTTSIVTPDNKLVILPNGPMSNGTIVNRSAMGSIRVDLTVGISYSANIDQAKAVLSKVLEDDTRVLADPSFTVAVQELADSSVNLAVRPFVKVDDYWDVYFDVLANCKNALDAANIAIPFPQRDVHIHEVRAK